MKYRKKPVVVEAYKTDKEIVIHTLEGDMKASIGDYIITGVNGEQYPCKPDIFEKTYEAVTNTNYDRIKAMSVDETAECITAFLTALINKYGKALGFDEVILTAKEKEETINEWKKWLGSEVS